MLSDREGCLHSIVVGNPGDNVMRDIHAANAVMKKIEQAAVRAIDSHERSLHLGLFIVLRVRDIGIVVLQPRVQNQPEVHDKVGATIKGKHRTMPAQDAHQTRRPSMASTPKSEIQTLRRQVQGNNSVKNGFKGQ